jgi:hypothetical protein
MDWLNSRPHPTDKNFLPSWAQQKLTALAESVNNRKEQKHDVEEEESTRASFQEAWGQLYNKLVKDKPASSDLTQQSRADSAVAAKVFSAETLAL